MAASQYTRPVWAPSGIWPGGSHAEFDSVCPITGDAVYTRTDNTGRLRLYILPNENARENQRRALLFTSISPVKTARGEKESQRTERKSRRKQERHDRVERAEARYQNDWEANERRARSMRV